MITILFLAVLAYLLGSIPSSVWIGKAFYDIDVRDYGSGNAGASNTFRILGVKPGIVVLLMDVLKGLLAGGLVYLQHEYNPYTTHFQWVNLKLVYGGLAVLGHLYPIFAEFKGGKGIATLFGMILAIHWLSAVGIAAIFLIILFSTRFVSLSSITAAISFPVSLLVVFQYDNPYYIAFGIGAAILVLLTHKKNIKRLLTGAESKANILKKHRRK